MAVYLGYKPREIELELINKSESLFRIIRLEGVWDESANERAIFPPEAFDKEMNEGDKAKGVIRYNELVGKMLPLEDKMRVG